MTVFLPVFKLRFVSALLLLGLLAAPAAAQRHRPSKAKKAAKTTRAERPAPRRSRTRAKSKEQLERERQANLSRIEEAGKVLTQTTQKKQATLGQLNVIKEKLTVKQGQIQHISTQLQGIETNVHQTVKQVLSTQEQLARLKEEYGHLMYAASKTSSGFNQLMFLFASESFNQFVVRLRYVRQYTEERQKQALRIIGAQQQLSHELDGLTQQRQRQKSLLTTQLVENRNLLGLKSEQDEVVQQLSQQEQGLRQELAERQQAVARLDDLIAQRVREEIARAAHAARLAAAAARRRAAARATAAASASRRRASASRSEARNDEATTASSSDTARDDDPSANPESDAPEETVADRRASRVALTPETALVSSGFAGNRGRLPWPVAHGFVAQHFGRHPHPVLRHVTVDNRGVDIQTNQGEPVRAVFGGRVLTVAQVPGMNTIVMIQHGEYFTVYAKLRSVNVHEGEQVSAREAIGTAATDADGTAQVQFQVWRNSANLNPESWLGRK
ncbi:MULTISPECIES: murein hydrolase activator EnvC family protein [Hymenobacter]|uniref:murein hydrolase activator EnvC family protein n=1 Tax=Hymenobacter TaxID=89966 RepID=UPI002867E7F3|nr:peptidoglycan DD-metalloendopeptidase family protein [Hymenobacter sp. KCTC 23674]